MISELHKKTKYKIIFGIALFILTTINFQKINSSCDLNSFYGLIFFLSLVILFVNNEKLPNKDSFYIGITGILLLPYVIFFVFRC